MAMPRMHVEVGSGTGHPLLLLHGVGRNGRDFRPLLPWLADRRTALWDHRGHGRSDRATGRYVVVDYASDVIDWIEHSDFEQLDLYGHSLGALVAMRTAAQLPARVRSVVLEDPPSPAFLADLSSSIYCFAFPLMQQMAASDADVETITARLADVRMGPGADAPRAGDLRDEASIRFSARCLKSVDPEVFTPLLAGRWFDGYDFEATAAAIACPTLLLHGEVECGGMLPSADARRLGELLSRSTVVPFAGAGHLLHWMRLEETVRSMLAFYESL